jgi:hypothetical protein
MPGLVRPIGASRPGIDCNLMPRLGADGRWRRCASPTRRRRPAATGRCRPATGCCGGQGLSPPAGRRHPAHSFRTLLEHLATLTANQVHLLQQPYPVTTELLATPAPLQRRAFDLVGAPIPLILI